MQSTEAEPIIHTWLYRLLGLSSGHQAGTTGTKTSHFIPDSGSLAQHDGFSLLCLWCNNLHPHKQNH